MNSRQYRKSKHRNPYTFTWNPSLEVMTGFLHPMEPMHESPVDRARHPAAHVRNMAAGHMGITVIVGRRSRLQYHTAPRAADISLLIWWCMNVAREM